MPLFELSAEQKIFDIGGVRVGGVPGRDPTVLIGTIFYRKQALVEDEQKGLFDREKAEKLIRLQEEMSDITGNPCMLDIEGSTAQSLERFIGFTAETTDVPMLIGGPTPEVRQTGLRLARDAGLSGRCVYNSLMPGYREEEIEAIKDAGVESAVLLAYNVTDMTPGGRFETLAQLLDSTRERGLEKPLLDAFVMDIPSLGIAFRAMKEAKDRLGFPTGCGPHNAVGLWKGLKSKMGLRSARSVVASVNAFTAAAGADWILYGPIEAARVVFPAVAMVDAAYAFPCLQGGYKIGRSHPLFKIA